MSAEADDEPTTNGFDYDSETASLTEEDKEEIKESIENNIKAVIDIRKQPFDLPETVSVLECKNGTKVYLVGTAHFSKESIDEVVKIMSHTRPDFVVVELCSSRTHVLLTDEEKIKQEMKHLSIVNYIKVHGASHGLLQYLLLRLSAYLVDMLGMAPGGEFRAAAQEALKQPHCHIVLGDRPVAITLQRAFNALGPWTKLRLVLTLIFDLGPITKEQVEAMKKSDFLEEMLMKMAGDHPELTRIVLEERDMYLAKSIWSTTGMAGYKSPTPDSSKVDNCGVVSADHPTSDNLASTVIRSRFPLGDRHSVPETSSFQNTDEQPASANTMCMVGQIPSCCPFWPSPSVLPRVVVAVVGIGHVAGIKKHWDTAEFIDQQQFMTIIEPPLSWKLFKWSFRALMLSAVVGVGYGVCRCSYKLGSTIWRLWT
ncbi:hypothetical protein EG68_09041 [Paragonimus skrjabini miyazakii]|uniref:TraB domain-containing protein n=1 Tax=Paragonimus skrjabini miyazakii TaxID=59628 RepID=A0A8S9YNE5_9TREM|nr:hypothetical protein EG68_09041 [Paragonimus skrjabini miyazakii]